MPLGIDLKVDYAFKRVFGDPRNSDILIHLLSAILRPEIPIESIEIINPFSDKDFAEDKLTVLDIKARDQKGQRYNVEMQLLLPQHFKSRILYYWAGLFREQLREGDSYSHLRPTISICLVNQELFPDVDRYHLAFELLEREHQTRFTDLIQVHVLQLPKLVQTVDQLRGDLDAWIYFFRYAESMDPGRLPAIINQPIYLRAIEELAMLTRDEQERERYEARLKAIRDQQSLLEDALEEGIQKGIEQGVKKGIERGIEQGIEQGRGQGLERGEHIGRIHAYERLLKRPLTPSDDLVQLASEELRRRADALEAELTGA